MQNKKRFLIILVNLILVLFITSNVVFGSDLVSDFKGSIYTTGSAQNETAEKAGEVVGIIQVVGTMVAVGMMIVLGIKYVLGSAEEKAEYKKTMLPYITGATLIFGFSNITQIIYNWAVKL